MSLARSSSRRAARVDAPAAARSACLASARTRKVRAMSEFVPPYPERPKEPLSPLAMIADGAPQFPRRVRREVLRVPIFFDPRPQPPGVHLQQPGHRGAGVYRVPRKLSAQDAADAPRAIAAARRRAVHQRRRSMEAAPPYRRADRACVAHAGLRADDGRGGGAKPRPMGAAAARRRRSTCCARWRR